MSQVCLILSYSIHSCVSVCVCELVFVFKFVVTPYFFSSYELGCALCTASYHATIPINVITCSYKKLNTYDRAFDVSTEKETQKLTTLIRISLHVCQSYFYSHYEYSMNFIRKLPQFIISATRARQKKQHIPSFAQFCPKFYVMRAQTQISFGVFRIILYSTCMSGIDLTGEVHFNQEK